MADRDALRSSPIAVSRLAQGLESKAVPRQLRRRQDVPSKVLQEVVECGSGLWRQAEGLRLMPGAIPLDAERPIPTGLLPKHAPQYEAHQGGGRTIRKEYRRPL